MIFRLKECNQTNIIYIALIEYKLVAYKVTKMLPKFFRGLYISSYVSL